MSTEMAQDLKETSDELPNGQTANLRNRACVVVPTPYVKGASLQLEIIQNYQDTPLPRVTAASITKILDVSMSSVMLVTITLDSGSNVHAVLKLYDHRFGKALRSNGAVHWPYTRAKQSLFECFVRDGDIDAFLTKLNQYQETAPVPKRPWHHLDGNVGESQKYEAALWQECDNMFNCETKAYEHLQSFQGAGIPRLLASVRLVGASSIIPSHSISKPAAKYWDVRGILLQYIPGINLINLVNSSINPNEWPHLIQRTVDLVRDINESGLVMEDCSPRNVIVDEHSLQPFIIDFAQCWLKDKMKMYNFDSGSSSDEWELSDAEVEEGDSYDPEVEYWDRVRDADNTGAIGDAMTTILQRQRGVKIEIRYM